MTPPRLLFVCTANISRSPYAERRARQALEGWDAVVSSAGVPGFEGRPMDPEMAALLEERGGDARDHVSRSLTPAIFAEAEVVLVFEFAQHMRIFEADPQGGRRVLSLGQLARAAERWAAAGDDPPAFVDAVTLVGHAVDTVGMDSTSFDVQDPYRRGRRIATDVADEIDAHLDAVLPLLVGADLPPLAARHAGRTRRRRWPWG